MGGWIDLSFKKKKAKLVFPFTDDEQLHLQGGSHIGSRTSTVNLKVIRGLVLFTLTSQQLSNK